MREKDISNAYRGCNVWIPNSIKFSKQRKYSWKPLVSAEASPFFSDGLSEY